MEIDGRPLGGIFDRVHIGMDANGQPVSAQIYDFKTDQTGVDLSEKYRDQLDSYRAAAARLLDLPLNRITAAAVSVR